MITKENTPRRASLESAPQEGTTDEPYYWDEPWVGNNGPRISCETTRSLDAPTTARASPTAELETAMPMSITRINSVSIKTASSPQSEGGVSARVEKARRFRILSETSTAGGTDKYGSSPSPSVARELPQSEGRRRSHESIQFNEGQESEESQSSGERSSAEQEITSVQLVLHSGREYASSEDNFTMQQSSVVGTSMCSIGFPSVIPGSFPAPPTLPRTPASSKSPISNLFKRSSWLDFDFDSLSRRNSWASTVLPPRTPRSRKRFSFLDEAFRNSFDLERNSPYYGKRNSDLAEEICGDSVRAWMNWRKGDDVGWDGVP
jgi:hypothetical protein